MAVVRKASVYILDADPVNGTSTVWTLTNSATGGDFKLKWKSHKGAAFLISGIGAAALQAYIRGLAPSLASVTVTGTGPYTITAAGQIGKQAVDGNLTLVENNVTGGTIALTVATPGVTGTLLGQDAPALAIGPTGTLFVNSSTDEYAPTWVHAGAQT